MATEEKIPSHAHSSSNQPTCEDRLKKIDEIINKKHGEDRGIDKTVEEQKESKCDPATIPGKWMKKGHDIKLGGKFNELNKHLESFRQPNVGCDKKLGNDERYKKAIKVLKNQDEYKNKPWEGPGDPKMCEETMRKMFLKWPEKEAKWKKFEQEEKQKVLHSQEIFQEKPINTEAAKAAAGLILVIKLIEIIFTPWHLPAPI